MPVVGETPDLADTQAVGQLGPALGQAVLDLLTADGSLDRLERVGTPARLLALAVREDIEALLLPLGEQGRAPAFAVEGDRHAPRGADQASHVRQDRRV